MKVFAVVTERDGETTKSPGHVETEIGRTTRRFAAETIESVWESRFWRDPEETIVAIYEEHPAIVVLRSGDAE